MSWKERFWCECVWSVIHTGYTLDKTDGAICMHPPAILYTFAQKNCAYLKRTKNLAHKSSVRCLLLFLINTDLFNPETDK